MAEAISLAEPAESAHKENKEEKVVEFSREDLDGWTDWRGRLPEAVLTTVPEKFQRTLDAMVNSRLELEEASPQENRIAVIISAKDARDVLPETIHETSQQIKENGLWGEIYVILNNGGGNTSETIGSAVDENIDKIIKGETQPLDKLTEESRSVPRHIELDTDLKNNQEGQISLVIIDQKPEGDDNQGKIRAVRDIATYLYTQTLEGGYCPELVELKDAETRLRTRDIESGRIFTDEVSGLGHMLRTSKGGRIWVGAKNFLTPFDDSGDPDWRAKKPPIQEAINVLHGQEDFEWLPGGECLGDYRGIISMLKVMGQELPGVRVEDSFLTICARTFGIKTVVDKEVVHANRCPSSAQREEADQQMLRWFRAQEGIKNYVGSELSKIHTNFSLIKVVATNLGEAAKQPAQTVKGLVSRLKLEAEAREKPDDISRGEASW